VSVAKGVDGHTRIEQGGLGIDEGAIGCIPVSLLVLCRFKDERILGRVDSRVVETNRRYYRRNGYTPIGRMPHGSAVPIAIDDN
jgi:hypothetical protein